MRHRLIVFHDRDSVFRALLRFEQAWRVLRVRNLDELETELEGKGSEILVTDSGAHTASLGEILALLRRHAHASRVFLCLSRITDPATFAGLLIARGGQFSFATMNAAALDQRQLHDSSALIETLYRLRLQPYRSSLSALCVSRLGLAGSAVEGLPAVLMDHPWSLRRISDVALALGVPPEDVVEVSRSFEYPRTQHMLFAVRAHLAAALFATGAYTWPESRETLKLLHASRFQRRLRAWLGLDLDCLLGMARRVPTPPGVPPGSGTLGRESDQVHMRNDLILASRNTDGRRARTNLVRSR